MKPLLHPSSFINSFFFFASLLMISINVPTCVSKDYTNCTTSFSCESSGNSSVSNLKYPFWGENRDMYCGSVPNPNMELTCEEDGVPKLTINDVKYRILDWDNTTQILKVARDDYWDNICDVSNSNSYKNSSFNSVFQVESNTYNYLTLLYYCVTSANTTTSDIVRTDCGNIGSVYAVLDTAAYTSYCTSSLIVVVPLLGSQASSLVSQGRVTEALKEGFECLHDNTP